jgi:hypothetical protein
MQVAGNPAWLTINKQAGNEIKPGDVVYGDIVPNQWNTGFDFKAAQRPIDGPQTAHTAQPTTQTPNTPQNGSTGVTADDKLDYIIAMLEDLKGQPRTVETPFGPATETPGQSLDDLDI